jgi:ABC-type glycerol-3-phosphate transport system substrate-binding protein
MRRLLPILTVAILSLAGCSSGSHDGDAKADGSDPSSSASTGSDGPRPACGDIWKAGATLPADYDTCYVNGTKAVQDVTECTDDTRLIVYNDEMFARTGGEIVRPKDAPLQDLPVYSKAYAACTGE